MDKLKVMWNKFEYRKEMLCAIPGLLLIFFTMYYSDIVVTSRYSFVFLDSLFDNRFASFYENAMNIGLVPEGAVYDIGTYIVFAIWALPLWVLRLGLEFEYTNVWVLLYFKLLIVVFICVFIFLIYKLALKIGIKKELGQYIAVLTMTSLVLVFSTLVAAQYDIIPLTFTAYGLLKVLEGDKNKFIISFSLALIMKPFSIFTFVLILLIIEKKIFIIVRDFILGLSPLLISKILYIFNEKKITSNNAFFEKNIDKVFGCTWESGINSFSIFIMLLTIIYIGAYINEKKDTNRIGRDIIFFGVTLWFSFIMFFQIYPYWSIYLMLFFPLAIGLIIEKTQIALIMDLIINGCFSVLMIIKYYWVYCSDSTFKYLILKDIVLTQGNDVTTVWGVLKYLGIVKFEPAIEGLMLGTMIAIVYLIFIMDKKYAGISDIDIVREPENEKIMRVHLYMRGIILLAWFIVSFGIIFIKS